MGTSPTSSSSAQPVSYSYLYAHQQQLVGQTVQVTAKAYFLDQCPPNGSGCSLKGYLADPSRTELTASETDQAIALSQGGALLSCPDDGQSSHACEGWRDATSYQVVCKVEHQVLGGRETTYVQLDVNSKTPA